MNELVCVRTYVHMYVCVRVMIERTHTLTAVPGLYI